MQNGIRFSRQRMAVTGLIALVYATGGFLMMFSSVVGFFVGAGVTLIFGRLFVQSIERFRGKTMALVIDEEGLIDNSSWDAVGRVRWEEIEVIRTKTIFLFYKRIEVRLLQPNVVMARQPNPIKRISNAIKTLFRGTPVLLDHRTMAVSYNELAQIMEDIDLNNPGFSDLSKHLVD